jgi:hypothetical protein
VLLITIIEILMYYRYNLYDYIIKNYTYIIFIYDMFVIIYMICYVYIYIYIYILTSNINYITNIIIN